MDKVHCRLIDLAAEDEALEDTIYQLGVALNSDAANVDLDKFVKVCAATTVPWRLH